MEKYFICRTSKDVEKLLNHFEQNNSIVWICDGKKPTQWNPLDYHELPFCIVLDSDHRISIDRSIDLGDIENSDYMNNNYVIANVEIKPGMILYLDFVDTDSNDFWIVFPTKDDLGVIPFNGSLAWTSLEDIKNRVSAIRDTTNGCKLSSGKLLWESCVEITMDQIAKKFGVNVNQIKIKK